MTSQQCISALDRALARDGEDIVLRRPGPNGNVDVTVRAFVRAPAAVDLVGTLNQSGIKVIMSPTEIAAVAWPDGEAFTASTYKVDPHLPRNGDTAFIQGRPRNVTFAEPIYVAGELVRIELTVSG